MPVHGALYPYVKTDDDRRDDSGQRLRVAHFFLESPPKAPSKGDDKDRIKEEDVSFSFDER